MSNSTAVSVSVNQFTSYDNSREHFEEISNYVVALITLFRQSPGCSETMIFLSFQDLPRDYWLEITTKYVKCYRLS